MSIKQKIGAALAIGSLAASMLAPASAFADQTCTISGNGENSTNRCRLVKVKRVRVQQSNTARVRTEVVIVQNTGDNEANNTTNGGDVKIDTGNATSTVTITVSGNTNTATVN